MIVKVEISKKKTADAIAPPSTAFRARLFASLAASQYQTPTANRTPPIPGVKVNALVTTNRSASKIKARPRSNRPGLHPAASLCRPSGSCIRGSGKETCSGYAGKGPAARNQNHAAQTGQKIILTQVRADYGQAGDNRRDRRCRQPCKDHPL